MPVWSPIRSLILCLALAVFVPLTAACNGYGDPHPGDARVLRFILVPMEGAGADPTTATGLRRLSGIAGVELVHLRSLPDGGHVLLTSQPLPPAESERVLRRLMADPSVARVEQDRRVMH